MGKLTLLNLIIRTFICLIINVVSPLRGTAQLLNFAFEQSKGTLYVVDISKNDTLCKESFILNGGSNPVWCQNDSLFFVLTELSFQTFTCYDFFV